MIATTRVRFVFQPGEESFPGGALTLVREGVTEGLSAIVAFHVDPTLEPGRIGVKHGPVTASADGFTIDADGKLDRFHVTSSSGSAVLDEGALSVVLSAAPFAPLPAAFHLSRLHITASFRYRIEE